MAGNEERRNYVGKLLVLEPRSEEIQSGEGRVAGFCVRISGDYAVLAHLVLPRANTHELFTSAHPMSDREIYTYSLKDMEWKPLESRGKRSRDDPTSAADGGLVVLVNKRLLKGIDRAAAGFAYGVNGLEELRLAFRECEDPKKRHDGSYPLADFNRFCLIELPKQGIETAVGVGADNAEAHP